MAPPNTGQKVGEPVGDPFIGMVQTLTGRYGDPGDMCYEVATDKWYYCDQTDTWTALGGTVGGAATGVVFTLDVDNANVWTDLQASVDLFAVGDYRYTNITTIPIQLAAGGFFKAFCSAPGAPAGFVGNFGSSVLSVSNLNATQVFSTYQTGSTSVTGPGVPIHWGAATWINVGSDLHLDATTTQVTSTAGGVFVASLFGAVWREA